MSQIKVVSFDVEGTLVTPKFSHVIWHEAIPRLYAQKSGISVEDARANVERQYDEVGQLRVEWYDIGYWFNRFKLGDYGGLLANHLDQVEVYPEVEGVLSRLGGSYELVIASGSSREFLELLLGEIGDHFARVFSSVSDFRWLKTADFYLNMCQALEVHPQEVAHVGDSRKFDLTTPREVGIRALHLDRDGRQRGEEVVRNLSEFELKLREISSQV